MICYSDTLTRTDLEGIATDLGMELYNAEEGFHGARRRRMSFTLRPVTERFRRHDPDISSPKGYRRVWAVSWEGHWQFMAIMFDRDPNAEIKSAVAHWYGATFRDLAPHGDDDNAPFTNRWLVAG